MEGKRKGGQNWAGTTFSVTHIDMTSDKPMVLIKDFLKKEKKSCIWQEQPSPCVSITLKSLAGDSLGEVWPQMLH